MNRYAFFCDDAYRAIQRQADGLLSEPDGEALRVHVAACDRCRELAEEMTTMRAAWASLPVVPFPDDALERVWERTIRRPEATHDSPRPRRWAGYAISAAAVIVLLAAGRWALDRPSERPIADAELARLAAQTRFVFQLTGDALSRVEKQAVNQLLADQLSPALHYFPLKIPQNQSHETRSAGT